MVFDYHFRTVVSLTPRLVCRVIIPVSLLAFGAGFVTSGAVYFREKTFDVKAAVISDLESPDDNPRGYGWSAAGTAVCAIVLAPAVVVFFRRLRKGRPKLALAGAVLFALGLGAAISIGILAPFTRGYTPVHVQLAYAAFIGICGGTLLHLLAVRASRFLIAMQGGVLLFLIYLYVGPEFFDNDRLLTSLAFWEWILCVDCGAALLVLARAVEVKCNAGAQRNRG